MSMSEYKQRQYELATLIWRKSQPRWIVLIHTLALILTLNLHENTPQVSKKKYKHVLESHVPRHAYTCERNNPKKDKVIQEEGSYVQFIHRTTIIIVE